MTEQWVQSQEQLWQSWFNFAKQADVQMPELQQESEKAFQMWQESMQQVMDAQQKWAKTWGSKPVGMGNGQG